MLATNGNRVITVRDMDAKQMPMKRLENNEERRKETTIQRPKEKDVNGGRTYMSDMGEQMAGMVDIDESMYLVGGLVKHRRTTSESSHTE